MTSQPLVLKVNSLNQGISKQAASLRFPAQVADAENVDFTVVDGARKRPGGQTIAAVAGVQANSTYRMHRIERDDEEEYAVIYGPKAGGFFLEVIDLSDGSAATVTIENNATDYLGDNGATVDDLRFVTVADTTFIVNTKKPTATNTNGNKLDAATMPIQMQRTSTSPLQFTVDQTTFGERSFYQQVLRGDPEATSPSGNFRLNYLPGATAYETSNIPYNASAEDVQVALQGDGLNEEGLDPFPFGKVICTGGPLPEGDIFINISTDLEVSRKIGIPQQPQGATYSVDRGSNDRDPAPQFIRDNLPIRDITFFRNRLCFASDEYLAFSRSDDVFQFYLTSPIAVTAADPIELQISATDVNIIENVTPFRNTLVVLTKAGRQFELRVDGSFTSETAAITQSTAYDTQLAKPAMIGNRLYMAGTNDKFSSFLEYYYEETFASNSARIISEHVDTLIPPDIKRIDTCPTNEQVIVFPATAGDIIGGAVKVSVKDGSGDEDGSDEYDELATWTNDDPPTENDSAIITDTHVVTFDGYYTPPGFQATENPSGIVSELYIYRTRFNGSERVQSAWSKWTFGGDALMDMFIIDDSLFLLRRQTSLSDGATRLKIDRFNLGGSRSPDFAGFSREVHLDHMIQKVGAVDDGETTFTLTAEETDLTRDTAVDSSGNEYALTQNGDGTEITITGEVGTAVVLGRKFDMNLELGEVFMRSPQNQPIEGGRVSMQKMIVTHTASGPYDVEIDATHSGAVPTRTVSKTATSVDTGRLTVPILGQPRDMTITIDSENSYPVTITGIEYHGKHSTNLE